MIKEDSSYFYFEDKVYENGSVTIGPAGIIKGSFDSLTGYLSGEMRYIINWPTATLTKGKVNLKVSFFTKITNENIEELVNLITIMRKDKKSGTENLLLEIKENIDQESEKED